MKAIVAVDQNWGIGYEGRLLFHISADLRHFKELTAGRAIVYGRKTLATFPHARPLPGRRNIILSHDPAFTVPGAEVCRTPEQAAVLGGSGACVIGGASIYRIFLPLCTWAEVTQVGASCRADRHFENLDADPGWAVAAQSSLLWENGLSYRFVTYRRTAAPETARPSCPQDGQPQP